MGFVIPNNWDLDKKHSMLKDKKANIRLLKNTPGEAAIRMIYPSKSPLKVRLPTYFAKNETAEGKLTFLLLVCFHGIPDFLISLFFMYLIIPPLPFVQ